MAATITGRIVTQSGAFALGVLTFRTLSAPLLDGSDLVSNCTRTVTLTANGEIPSGTTFPPGDYKVTWSVSGVANELRIAVPDDDLSHTLYSLVSDSLVYTFAVDPTYALASGENFRHSGNVLQIYNITTGKWVPLWCFGPDEAMSVSWGTPEE